MVLVVMCGLTVRILVRQRLSVRTRSTYAKGWIVVNSYRGHNGALQGTRSFFAQMTTGGYSFAAIGNDNVLGSSEEYSFNLESVMESICTGVNKWPDYEVTVALP